MQLAVIPRNVASYLKWFQGIAARSNHQVAPRRRICGTVGGLKFPELANTSVHDCIAEMNAVSTAFHSTNIPP